MPASRRDRASSQGTIGAVSPERGRKVLDVNLTGVFKTIQAASRSTVRQRSGRVIATASTAGFRGDLMVGYGYTATKSAVLNLARYGRRVNAIAPKPFRMNIGGGRMHDPLTESSFADALPLGRVGNPDEIKGPAQLPASDNSSFMTVSVLSVDGRALAW